MGIKQLSRVLAGLAVVTALAACQTVTNGSRIDYQNARVEPPLEVPPGMTPPPSSDGALPPSATSYSEHSQSTATPVAPTVSAGAAPDVLPQFPSVHLARAGDDRWLVVQAPPAEVWSKVRQFLLQNGLLIAQEHPRAGIIETEWAESHPKVGTAFQQLMIKTLKSVYSTGLRDRYRIRLERGTTPGTTEVYITHQGMKEVIVGGSGPETVRTLWESRPPDPELEAEMLQRLMVYLGATPEQAKAALAAPAPPPRAALGADASGRPELTLDEAPAAAWPRLGISLDHIGAAVQDQNRAQGLYYVRYGTGKAAAPYRVSLTASGEGSQVRVLDQDGAPASPAVSKRILNALYQQLK